MDDISKSPDRNTFRLQSYLKKLEEDPNDQAASSMIEWYQTIQQEIDNRTQQEEWKKDNLEYDLRITDWILEKVRSDDVYAQHLYAALCNNDFMKNDVWPILTEKRWSCSWRHAGSIISDMQEHGDYIDWYCSGIQQELSEEEFQGLTEDQQNIYLRHKAFVPEGVVTDEIQKDLFKLGWIVINDSD